MNLFNSIIRRLGWVAVASVSLSYTVTVSSAEISDRPVDLPQQVSIRELLRIVRDKSPRYALARGAIETAKAEVVAANVLPNPTINYGRYSQMAGQVGTMYDGNTQENILLEVPVLIAGQRGARTDAAERKVEVAEADVEVEYSRIVRETWRLFIRLLAGQQRVAVLKEAERELARVRDIITGKKTAGTASRYDVMRISQELQSLKMRLRNVHTDNASMIGELNVLLGFSHWKPEVIGTLERIGVPADMNELWRLARHSNPELKSARRNVAAANADLERSRRERWPVPSIFLGMAYTDKPYGNTAYTGVSVELPIFDRGQGGMARAAAEKNTAVLRREVLLSSTRQELERTIEVLARRRATLAEFERDVLVPLPTLKQMAEDAYRMGRTSLLELLDSYRSRTDMRLNHLDLLVSEMEAEVDVMAATGLLTAEQDGPV